jgi:hypothetical protein
MVKRGDIFGVVLVLMKSILGGAKLWQINHVGRDKLFACDELELGRVILGMHVNRMMNHLLLDNCLASILAGLPVWAQFYALRLRNLPSQITFLGL